MKKLIILLIFIWPISSIGATEFKTKIAHYKLFDSLLDHVSYKEINKQIDLNKNFYETYEIDNTFVEIFFKTDVLWFDHLSFKIKPEDPEFIIYGIGAMINYQNKFEKCEWMFDFETKHLSKYSDLRLFDTYEGKHQIDPSGNSYIKQNFYVNKDDINVEISCTDFDVSVQTATDNHDYFGFYIYTDEVRHWFND